ncbi:hypothetical protein QFC19_009180 [Naganishia cerealis]|uniref:Uncharacterized protein n=1 Tax=Naganishia cerealis TaxID=610337 RepID=A0ACC2UW22_9TREE|nr:hypothetical protein QFC19_009180 [Naganishia cerealis]
MGAATKIDPISGWKWVFRTQLITNGLICLGFLLVYHGRDDGFIHQYVLENEMRRFVSDSNATLSCSELFRHGWNFPIAVFVIAVEGSLFYLLNNIWPSQVFALYAHDPIIAALYLLPFFMTILVISPVLSIYATKYKDVKWPIVAGFVFFLSAIIGYGTTTATSNKAAIATLGGTVGLAIAEVIYAAKTNAQVPAAIASAAIPLGFDPSNLGSLIPAVLSGQGIAAVPGITGQIIGAAMDAAHNAQAKGFRTVWLSFIPAGKLV